MNGELVPDGAHRRRGRRAVDDPRDRVGARDGDAALPRGRGDLGRQRERRERGARRAGVRRLRRRRARVPLGRLQGCRPARQDPARARERSAGARRGARAVRRQGDDVLRAVDVQVRGGGAARRRRDADRPRHGAGGLSLAHGGGIVGEGAAHAPARPEAARAARGARVDHRRARHRRCSGARGSISPRCARAPRRATSAPSPRGSPWISASGIASST